MQCPRVVVVDESTSSCLFIAAALREAGCEVDIAPEFSSRVSHPECAFAWYQRLCALPTGAAEICWAYGTHHPHGHQEHSPR